MGFKKSVLWIEDDAAYNLDYLASPLIMDPHYDLTLAVTITEALHFLRSRAAYDAIVFDLRVPPGSQSGWKTLHQELSQSKTAAQLGFHLMVGLLGLTHPLHDKHGLVIQPLLRERVTVQNIGIMSVDVKSTILRELGRIDIGDEKRPTMTNLKNRIESESFYKHKEVGMNNRSLLQLVKAIIDGGGEPCEPNLNTGTPAV